MTNSTAITDNTEVLDSILSSPLIAANNTRSDLASLDLNRSGGSVYFGTGLATPKAFTTGLPFDYLSMLVTAELLRRSIGADQIVQEISDTHCIQNAVASPDEVKAMALKQKAQVDKAASNLGLSGKFKCVLASDYQGDERYKEDQETVLQASNGEQNHYFLYQWAGDYYLTREEDIRVKLGWVTDDNPEPKGLDERCFNRGYKNLGLPGPSYAYTFSAYNFDPKRSRVSPYTCIPGEQRLMLAFEDNAGPILANFLNSMTSDPNTARRAIGRLALLTQSFEDLFGQISIPTALCDDAEDFSSGIVTLLPKDSALLKAPSVNILSLGNKIDDIRYLIS